MSEAAGSPERRRRGPARSLTRERVVDAAVTVMATQGLNAVSFRTVGMSLGVDPKALYTYVTDKDDLLAAMYDRIVADVDMPRADDPRSPVEQVVGLLVSVRRVLIKNPDVFGLRRPLGVPGLDVDRIDQMAASILGLDADAAAALRLLQRAVQYTLGSASIAQLALPTQPDPRAVALLDTGRHPQAMSLLREQPFREDEADFTRTVRALLETRLGEG